MFKNRWTVLSVALVISLAGSAPTLCAADKEAAEESAALTIVDPEIPVDELELILKAFTKQELLVEADGWRALLREKVVEIGTAEIAVKRQNKEIQKAEEVQDKAREAAEQLEEIRATAEEAKATGDAQKIREAEHEAEEARETVDSIKTAVDEVAEAARKTAEVHEQMDTTTREGLEETVAAAGEAQEALDRVEEAAEGADAGSGESVREAAGKAEAATEDAQRATAIVEENVGKGLERAGAGSGGAEALDQTAMAMEEAENAKREEKVDLLETVNELREDRTRVIDNLNAVLGELESKTDTEDADTLAKIKDYRLYIQSVQGIELDVKDTTSSWIAIKGWLVSDEGGLRFAWNILKFSSILLIAWMVSGLLRRAVKRALGMSSRVSKLLEHFLVGAIRWIVMAVGIIMALAALEISVGPLLAIVGAAGFVIAFALQDSLSNFASGIMILFFRPFDVGNVIEAGGVSGTVLKMNLVSTTIRTFDNKNMVVPNNKIWQDVITNATGVTKRRIDMEFGIGYDDDIDQAQAILEDIVENHPKVLKHPEPTIRMNTLAESSVNFVCRPWAKTDDYWDVYRDVTIAVKKRFDAAGIGIPFPQRDVHLYLENAPAKADLPGIAAKNRPRRAVHDQSPELDADGDGENGNGGSDR